MSTKNGTMIELPQPPAPTIQAHSMLASTDLPLRYHTAAALEAHGKACARAALERAAQICDEINSESGGGWETFGEAIRAEIERD